ncbi:MAG: hypothetical protein AAF990_21045 [Bacteroidota bacterium]
MKRFPTTSQDKDYSHWLFFGIVLSYCWLYAPFGINETDGGFITAYAWRMLDGEWPYRDFIYVRPPGSLWLRYLEMSLTPTWLALLSERLLFYGKMALASSLGAALLFQGPQRWWGATLAFVVSVHNYPAAAWHTVDGIVWSVAAVYLIAKAGRWWWLGALCGFMAMFCKQSFYPLLPVLVVLATWLQTWRRGLGVGLVILLLWGLFFTGLYGNGLLADYLGWTSGASSLEEAFQRGILDYFRLHPLLWGATLLLIPAFLGREWKGLAGIYCWYAFLLLLVLMYVWRIYQTQDFTVPVQESRLLFLIGLGYLFWQGIEFWRTGLPIREWDREGQQWITLAALLSISWMASISWGYNFPILFSLPMIAVGMQITTFLNTSRTRKWGPLLGLLFLMLLLMSFRSAYQFVYRDGVRSQMSCRLSEVYPQLYGIRSTPATCAKYKELKQLYQKYGDCFSVLPAFPLAHYLNQGVNPLPLDWVIRPEYNGQKEVMEGSLETMESCFIFVERAYGDEQLQSTKFESTWKVKTQWRMIEKGTHFEVYVLPDVLGE